LPRLWLWIREHIYIELEKIAKEKEIGIDNLVKEIIEDYIKGRLIQVSNSNPYEEL